MFFSNHVPCKVDVEMSPNTVTPQLTFTSRNKRQLYLQVKTLISRNKWNNAHLYIVELSGQAKLQRFIVAASYKMSVVQDFCQFKSEQAGRNHGRRQEAAKRV